MYAIEQLKMMGPLTLDDIIHEAKSYEAELLKHAGRAAQIKWMLDSGHAEATPVKPSAHWGLFEQHELKLGN